MRNLLLIVLVALAGCSTTVYTVNNAVPPIANGVYEIGKVEVVPRARFQPPPKYPFELRKAGISGEAVILFTVKKDGRVTDAIVVKATHAEFGANALEAVLRWRFAPAMVRSEAVDCRLMMPLTFAVEK